MNLPSARAILLPMLLLAAPLAAQGTDSTLEKRRYEGCVNAIPTDAAKAEQFAVQWRAEGGGLPARHCQALAQLHQERFAEAATTLAQAAQTAEAEKSPFAADFWGQAGNASFLAGDSKTAAANFTTAIAQAGSYSPLRLAAFHVDRARAYTDLGNLPAARADLDKALTLAPEDPIGWTLSAALARREDDKARSARDIAKASSLAPSNPDVMLEQANVAAAAGDMATARQVWGMVTRAAPGSAAAQIAERALAATAK